MTQTLHIFRKDMRRFRYELCVVVALTGAFAWADAAADIAGQSQFTRATMLAGLTTFFLVCAWWFLVTQLIHEEAPAGDRQFWVTRPYLWRHLLAAKLLFVVAFVNIPAGETAAPEIVELTLETPAGRRWSSGWIAAASTEADVLQVDPSPDGAFTWRQRVVVDPAFWQQARSGPLTVRGDVYAMLFGRSSVRLQDDGVTRVPGDGRCSLSFQQSFQLVNCLAPFHRPFTREIGRAHV